MEMMKMQQRAGFKLHACRQKRDEEISAAVRARSLARLHTIIKRTFVRELQNAALDGSR